MGIHGWKQLATWSLEHACLDEGQMKHAKEIFEKDWERFCAWVVERYGEYSKGLKEIDATEPRGE